MLVPVLPRTMTLFPKQSPQSWVGQIDLVRRSGFQKVWYFSQARQWIFWFVGGVSVVRRQALLFSPQTDFSSDKGLSFFCFSDMFFLLPCAPQELVSFRLGWRYGLRLSLLRGVRFWSLSLPPLVVLSIFCGQSKIMIALVGFISLMVARYRGIYLPSPEAFYVLVVDSRRNNWIIPYLFSLRGGGQSLICKQLKLVCECPSVRGVDLIWHFPSQMLSFFLLWSQFSLEVAVLWRGCFVVVSVLYSVSLLRPFMLVLLLVEFVVGSSPGLSVIRRWACYLVLLDALVRWYNYFFFLFFGKVVGQFWSVVQFQW